MVIRDTTNGVCKPDKNFTNQDSNGDGKCDLNCDTNGDGKPDKNIDTDGDGVADKNIDLDGDGKCDLNCDADLDNDKNIYYISLQDVKTLNTSNIVPGWSGTQSFQVNNNNPVSARYSLYWINVVNTFSEANNLEFEVTRNGKVILSGRKLPYQDESIIANEVIEANSTYTYVINYRFIESGSNQDVDQNKNFSANVKLETN